MSDRAPELEARVAELTEGMRLLEARVAALERAPVARRRPATAPAPRAAPAGVPPFATTVSYVGRTLLVLAGAFVLRALTDSGALPAAVGVGLGLAYAGAWVALADRAGRTGATWSGAFHGSSAVLVGFPLLLETTARFRLLPVATAAALLVALTAVVLGVAARRRLEALAWLVTLASAGTAVALAGTTGRAAPPALALVLLATATLWMGYVLDWRSLRWPVAIVTDLALLFLAFDATTRGSRDSPTAALLVLAVFLALTLASVATRTVLLGRSVVPFEVFQTAGAIAVGLGGAALVAVRSGIGAGTVGLVSFALGLAAYAVAFAFVDRRQAFGPNFTFYSSAAIVLVLAGSGLALPRGAIGLAWAALAVLAAALARRARRLTLAAHGAVYAVAAALVSGLGSHALEVAFATPSEPWGAPAPAALAVLAAIAATGLLAARAAPRTRNVERVPQLLLLALVACCVAGVVVGLLAPALTANQGPAARAGAVATLRTVVWVAGALLLAALGRLDGFAEAGWLAYPALAAIGLKILLEDLPRSDPSTLFVAFALYGIALIVVARVRRRTPRQPTASPGR